MDMYPPETSSLYSDTSSDSSDFDPVIMLPPQNTKFVGRERILQKIERWFRKRREPDETNILALYGMGGNGKSQIALEYAHRYRKQYGIILWISSETERSANQSIREAAARLKLCDVLQTDSFQNKTAVRKKLGQSDTPWLLIFDNVYDVLLPHDFLPYEGSGSIIYTSVFRHHGFNYVPYAIRVPVFPETEAIGCLLDHISLDKTVELNNISAAKLNQFLGGHPLAIVRVATFIRSCKLPIEQCARLVELTWEKSRDTLLIGECGGYLKDMQKVWGIPFEKLSETPRAIALLGMLSYLTAEEVPEALLAPEIAKSERLSDTLFWPYDIELRLAEAPLLEWALIERDPERQSLSLHRLVQKEFQHFLSNSQRQLAFDQVTFCLHQAFPKQDKGQYMHENWEQAEPLVDHIVTLNRHYVDTSTFCRLKPSLNYIRLLSNCAWFLFEKGLYSKAQEILVGGIDACERSRILKLVEVEVIYAHMLNTSAILDGIRCSFDSQIEKLHKVREIRMSKLPEDDEEISGVLNNLSLAYESNMQFDKALEYREQSLEVCLKHAESKSRETKIKKRLLTLARILVATNKLEEAQILFPGLLEYFKNIESWLLIGHLSIVWGNYYFAKEDFQSGHEKFSHALKQYEEIGKVKYHPEAVACLYKLGRVAFAEKNMKDAM
ncbi:uncharacterized protein TRIVIDRAFT_221152 [Trichoderma virens Gv29-8]|uniref:Uncharacterized protein n=1 Tax=Hypocrea virens (strain Gv29-8 / FGSC 10586) TaxID=413071 RepID=G9MPV2_HYPVG|nr:uncharacterized protein TRIVIDRAFT_221152 [Trichoderma virens Gv29-8]EHK23902.1 hypothetical protein TRIVIDRAFT_221152 [Trichoderma virens Gv29-8]UKZ50208.1 hypothetical protein TrVGV298_004466 [Trichoderma virens]